ncbi:hypothetical protein ACOSP7_028644 [Xanthoceras sorbifolium]
MKYKLSFHWVEVDARNVAFAVNDNGPYCGSAGGLVGDIKAFCKEVGVLKCQAIPRMGNSVAHTLAALAFSSEKEKIWFDVVPSCVASLL